MPAIKSNLKYFFLASLLLLAIACTKTETETPMVQKVSDDSVKLEDEAIKNLKLDKVVRGEFPNKLALMGKISVPEDKVVVVPSHVAGRTDAVFVASGEVVTAGQPLARIFSADFFVAREEYIQAVKESQKDPSNEESKHLLELSKKKLNALGISQGDADKWSADTGAKEESMLIRAPISGALIGKSATIGSIVNNGDTLFMIGDLSKVWFAGDIYPEDLPKVRNNQIVVIDPGNGGTPLKGKVSFISPVMDPNTRTIKIRALIDNPGKQLRADMYVQGNVILSTQVALIAPKSSLVRLQDMTFCFKRQPGNVFKKVPVTISGESTTDMAVTSGLDEGDEVVSEGGLLLDAALNGAGR